MFTTTHIRQMSEAPDPFARPQSQPLVGQPIAAMGQGMRTLVRQFLAILGLVMIAIAVPIAIVTPILPIGLPIAIVGVVLLGRNSLWGRRWMEGILQRHPRVEKFAPNWLMKLVFGRDKRPDVLD